MDLYYTAVQRNELLALVAAPGGWDGLIQHLQTLCPAFDLFKVSMEWADYKAAPDRTMAIPPLKAKGVFGDLLVHFPADGAVGSATRAVARAAAWRAGAAR